MFLIAYYSTQFYLHLTNQLEAVNIHFTSYVLVLQHTFYITCTIVTDRHHPSQLVHSHCLFFCAISSSPYGKQSDCVVCTSTQPAQRCARSRLRVLRLPVLIFATSHDTQSDDVILANKTFQHLILCTTVVNDSFVCICAICVTKVWTLTVYCTIDEFTVS